MKTKSIVNLHWDGEARTPTLVIENHPQDSRVKIREDGIFQTLDARMGMGGGNVPMVMEQQTFSDIAAPRNAQDGRGGVHSQMLDDPEENFVLAIGNGQVNDAVNPDVEISKTLNCMDDPAKVVTYTSSKASYHTKFSSDDKAETLVATDYKDPPIVYKKKKNHAGDYVQDVGTLKASGGDYGGGSETLVTSYQETTGTLTTCISKGTSNEIASNDMLVTPNSVVRRLTPLECERLQGFPDGWTDIGEWVDSKGKKHKDADSPRYKALGNSIALPYWSTLAEKIRPYLGSNPTMASLFDGIGGFPLVFSRVGVTPVWASEIEEFPMAVTKLRFPEKKHHVRRNKNVQM